MALGGDDLGARLAGLRIDRSSTPVTAKRGRGWLVAISIALALGGGALAVFRGGGSSVSVAPPSAPPPAEPTRAGTALTATGYLVPQRVANVGPTVAARVLHVHVAAGQEVRAGDRLVDLDPSDDERALTAARAHAAASGEQRRVTALELARTKLSFERERELAAQGATPRAHAEDLRAELAVLEAGVLAAEAATSARMADVSVIEKGLDRYIVVAPFDGLVLDVPAEVGEVVAPGVPLAELADPASLLVEVEVPEAKLANVRLGAPCEVVLDALPHRTLEGVVALAPLRVSRAKATGTAKVRLLSPTAGLVPGMAARIRLLAAASTPEPGDTRP